MFEILHNSIGDNEYPFTSATAYFEVYTGISKTFITDLPNQWVYLDVNIPYTIHKPSAGASNGTFRLYLDGDAQSAAGGKQWNGYLVGHSGGWQNAANIPTDAPHVKVHQWVMIPEPGEHTLRLQYAGTDTATIGTLRSRQFWQVWTLGDQGESNPPAGPGGVLLDVTESADSAAISSNTPNVELQREAKQFTTSASGQVNIAVTVPAKYCKVGGANATGKFRLYLNGTLLAEQAGPLITSNSTLPNGPWTDGTALSYTGTQNLPAGTHTLSLRYVGDTTLVCGIAKAGRSYHVEAL